MTKYLAVLLFLLLPCSAVPAEDPAALRASFLARLNQVRSEAGLPPLRLDETLERVAQRSAEQIRDNNAEPPGPESIRQIRLDLAKAGYEAHGWSHSFAGGPGDAGAIVAWWKEWNADSFQKVSDPDYQDLGIGITDLAGTPLYTFLLAWRESAYFARLTDPLLDLDRVREAMLAEVNRQRAAEGAPPLALDPRLSGAAQRHAEDMLGRAYYDHESPEGLRPKDRVLASGYPARIVAENIARGPTSVEEVMSAWMQSRAHRGNLLNPALTEIGVGCAVGESATGATVLWVQDFGRPRSF